MMTLSQQPADSDIRVRLHGGRTPLHNPILRQRLTQEYLILDAYVAGEPRVDLHPLMLSPALHAQAVAAAEGIYRAVGNVAGLAHADAEERARYGLHPEVHELAAASHAAGDTASLVRVDLLLGEDGVFRACEVNADCPGGHNEAFGLPRLTEATGFSDGIDPTSVVPATVRRLGELAGDGTVALIYATAYAEDLQVCALLRRMLLRQGISAILASPTALRWRDGALRVGTQAVTALYRYFPTEYMEGQQNLGEIVRAISARRVKSLSSFAQIYPQSKLAFARTFALRDTLPAADADAVTRHMPATFLYSEIERTELLSLRPQWVLKRALGRVGDEVFVGPLIDEEDWPALLDVVATRCAEGEVWLAQRFVPQRRIETPYGSRLVTLGVYLLDGRFVGYFARLTSESHVSHDALCLPVFVAAKEPRA